jgi:transposase
MNPTREQKEKLNRYADATRFTYNACVAAVNKHGFTANKMRLRNAFVTTTSYPKPEGWKEATPEERKQMRGDTRQVAVKNPFIQENKWLAKTPKLVRQQAAFQAAAAFKTAFANLRNKNIKRFRVGFRTKRHQTQEG